MDIKDLQNVKAPFDVLSIQDGSRHTIKGFAQNDPLGVGGGFFTDMPVVYFEGGGWLLVSDLLRHYEIAPFVGVDLASGKDKTVIMLSQQHFVCDYKTHKALRGPWTSQQVVDFINSQPDPKLYCNMSRYMLGKEGLYRGRYGGMRLVKDLRAAEHSVNPTPQ